MSRQLTEQKVYEDESDDDLEKPTEDEGFSLLKKSSEDPDNPWLLGHETKDITGFCVFFAHFRVYSTPYSDFRMFLSC